MKTNNLILPILLTIILLTSCNETPTDIGFPFVQDTVSVEAVSSESNPFIVKQTVFKQHNRSINMGGYLIGKSDKFKSATFIRFMTLKDTFKFITPDKIISSTIKMKALRYAFGDSLAPFAFDIYKVQKLWSPKTSWDSVFTDNADYIDYSKKMGEFNANIPLKDSGEFIYVDLNKELTSEWMFYGDDTTKYINKGIALIPNDNSKCIRKFEGPSLTADKDKTFFTEVTVKFYDANNKIDSVKMRTAMEYSLSDAPKPDNETDIILEGAVQYNTELQFDLSSLPDNISIHSASLELKLDKNKSVFSNYNTDSLRDLQIIASYRRTSGSDTLTTQEKSIPLIYGNKGADFITYYYNIFTFAVEQWVLRDGKKGMVMLSKAPINNLYINIDRYVFHGMNDPDPAMRPKLKIIYSKRPSYIYSKKGAK